MSVRVTKDSVDIRIKSLIGRKTKPGRMVGAELEVESHTRLPIIDSGTWTTVSDQSLRTAMGKEYVLQVPIPFEGVDTAITTLFRSLNNKEISDPIRGATTTSWHVHLNALELTPNQLMVRLFLYWLMEPLLIKYCGPTRECNTFCVQLKDSIRSTQVFNTKFFNDWITNPQHVFGDRNFGANYRYCAQNYTALAKFGSVEYRAMHGTLEYDEIMPWFNALISMWKCDMFKTPSDVLTFFYEGSLRQLFEATIDEPAIAKLYTKDMEEEAEEQALILIGVENNKLFSWEKWEEYIRDRHYIRVLEGTVVEETSPAPTTRRSTGGLNPTRTSLRAMGYTNAQIDSMLGVNLYPEVTQVRTSSYSIGTPMTITSEGTR